MQKIAQNGMMFKMMIQQAMIAGASPAGEEGGAAKTVEETEALGGEGGGEATNTKKARQRVADSTSPT